jgi:inosine triphosphate pyrophosphatase
MIFKRYEIGIRLETNASNEAMIGIGEIKDQLDPKLRRKDSNGIEFRTFCWCRNGETVLSEFNGMKTYSGRSDCKPTDRSNFGFLVRITDPNFIEFDDFKKIASTQDFDIPLKEALSSDVLISKYGVKIGKLMKKALMSITNEYPQLINDESCIRGPSIEGMGEYPDIDHNLRVKDDKLHNVYCIGDNTGIFRGIIPCMLSGYYLARYFHYRTRDIVFVTGNKNKVRETENIIGPLEVRDMDLPELQGTPEEIVTQKCQLAAEEIQGPVIVEDTSLCFNALGGMPGPYVKWFLKTTGIKGMVKMLDSFEDKSAYAQCIFAYSAGPGHTPVLFPGITRGNIVYPRGSTHFGWDPIFQPEGHDFTYAELDNGIKNKISHRYKAIKKLEAYLYN